MPGAGMLVIGKISFSIFSMPLWYGYATWMNDSLSSFRSFVTCTNLPTMNWGSST
eukprot:CAMPEP_0206512212 /NCGR_PEP_ID=MMETSP0324_2-20121206/60738_1 /ASSEMBLY_ACC=CAM_ASM_000836 /TAXON_ID=2866 /ORGANISM="Crypthecodinium cohnii, Strain Seligo" /LENGTH=54 /DNA_ID=CAMNT_0054004113 /DNA_START=54 /DNA_END=215 /DNA_ORIENTATION=+